MNSNGKNLFIFDFDGTVVDSTHSGFAKIQKILNIIDLPPIPEEELQKIWGKKFRDVAQIVLKKVGVPDYQLNQAISLFLKTEKNIIEEVFISEEMANVLGKIKNSSHLSALVTSRNSEDLEHGIQDFKVDLSYFNFIQTADQSEHHKPDGRVFNPVLKWAEQKEINHQNIIYCGDTLYDWGAAVSAKPPIKFVGVVSGVATASDFFATGAVDVVNGPNGLAEYIDLMYFNHQETKN